MRMWRITWRGNCAGLTLVLLATFRQALIDQLGFQGIGPGYGHAVGGRIVALAAFQEGVFAAHWDGSQLILHAFYAKAITPDALHTFVLTNLPWDGDVISIRDDMGEVP